MPQLILASASPARLSTLRAAGVEPVVRVSAVDEDALLTASAQEDLSTGDAVLLLARAKAHDVASRIEQEEGFETAIVVGCDSMLEFDGLRWGKPGDAHAAQQRWRAMRGRHGVLHTGHWVIDLRDSEDGGTGGIVGTTSSTTVHFAELTDEEIDAYVATGEPQTVAGAFTIDGLGGPYVERIDGDHHGVVGISLPVLRQLLAEIDVPWHTLRHVADS